MGSCEVSMDGGFEGTYRGFKGGRKGMAKVRLCSYLDGLDLYYLSNYMVDWIQQVLSFG